MNYAAWWESSRADVKLLQSKGTDLAVAAGTRKLWCFPSVAGLYSRCCAWGWGLARAGTGSCLVLPFAGELRGMLRSPMMHPLG